MMRKLEPLISEASAAAAAIRRFHGTIRIVSHYDADGISAASILSRALSREGKSFRLSTIKQLSEEKVKELASGKSAMTIFTDLGSGHLDAIKESLSGKVIVLDHHQIKQTVGVKGELENEGEQMKEGVNGRLPYSSQGNPNLIHINPGLYGMDDNLSGAGVAYFFARELSQDNIDLSYLAIVGALGDSQAGSECGSWGLAGANREILRDAKKSGSLLISQGLRLWGRHTRSLHKALEYCTEPCIPGITGSESASVQLLNELGIPLRKEGGWRTLSDLSEEEQKRLASAIIKERIRADEGNAQEIFGDVYEISSHPADFRDAHEFATMLNACGKSCSAHVGISMCMLDPGSFVEAKKLLSGHKRGVGRAIRWLKENSHAIKKTERCTYLLGEGEISEHIISNVASIFSKSGFVPESRPVLAFADAEDGMVKVSARAADGLVESGLSMQALLSEAASGLGGEGGGHKAAAGATIPRHLQDAFISRIEELLDNASNININTSEQEVTLNGSPAMDRRRLKEGRRQESPSVALTPSNSEAPSIKDDIYGTAKSQRGQERREEATHTGDKAAAGTAAKGGGLQKMEGQGLVRYLGSKDVQ